MRDALLPSFGCFAHTLQLVVEEGVIAQRAVTDILTTCRKVVGHFKHSATAYNHFHEIQKRLGIATHRLQQDIKTRWNSSYYMLQSVLELPTDITELTPYQLDLAQKVVEALQPIEEITKTISSDSVTIAVVIPFIRMLVKSLEKHHNDSGVRTMKKEMLKSLKRRFNGIEENKYVVIATLLDPRFKRQVLFWT